MKAFCSIFLTLFRKKISIREAAIPIIISRNHHSSQKGGLMINEKTAASLQLLLLVLHFTLNLYLPGNNLANKTKLAADGMLHPLSIPSKRYAYKNAGEEVNEMPVKLICKVFSLYFNTG